MPRVEDQALPLQDWCVLSLRPRGRHASLRAAAARCGARALALSPYAIACRADARTTASLARSLRADVVLYTSPNAVAAAAALRSLRPRRGQTVLAVGGGTRRALRRRGIDAGSPSRMDSEGLLAMPQLAEGGLRRVGLVTGSGGRNLIAPTLRERGAEVERVDVYARVPVPLSPVAIERLRRALESPQRTLLALGSGEALQRLLEDMPEGLRAPFSRIAVVAAGARLAEAARDAGFHRIAVATDARPASLLGAARDAFAGDAIV